MIFFKRLKSLLLLASLSFAVDRSSAQTTVMAARKPDGEWKAYPNRTLESLGAVATAKVDENLNKFGGWQLHKEKATGFFRVEKVNGRWWFIDPDGCEFIHKGVATVKREESPGSMAAYQTKFGSATNWANETCQLLFDHGFNGIGGWSDTEAFHGVSHPMVYTRLSSFMAGYGRKRGGTFSQPGHTGYPHDCLFVFDPGFETFCDEYAKELATTKDDPWLLGHFSDNEMPFNRDCLKGYLSLPPTDAGHQAAQKWLQQRHGANASIAQITSQDEKDFLGWVATRYYSIVSHAIKKYDPNHLYLGSRLYGHDYNHEEVFKACGPYVDVVSVNYYGAWTPSVKFLDMWTRESARPVLISEWYAKGMDSGMANTGGAGWVVKTQRDRGLFYQNFTLGLLQSRVCVGWHWFRYMDNDPVTKKADANDSNKGIVNNRYEPYQPLLDAMKPLNQRVYSLTQYFDKGGNEAGLEKTPPAKAN